MRSNFPRFARGQNAAEKILIGNNESVKLQNSTKVSEIIFEYPMLSWNFVKFHVMLKIYV